MNGSRLDDDLKISPAVIVNDEFRFIDATVGSLDIGSSVFRQGLKADRALISRSLHMNDNSTFRGAPIYLNGLKVNGQIDAKELNFSLTCVFRKIKGRRQRISRRRINLHKLSQAF